MCKTVLYNIFNSNVYLLSNISALRLTIRYFVFLQAYTNKLFIYVTSQFGFLKFSKMSEETSAGCLSAEDSSTAFAREFISSRMLDLEKEFTRFIEGYVVDLTRRISIVEHKLGNESNTIVSSQSEQTNSLVRSEATAVDKKIKSHGLIQQVSNLQDELSNTNARIKDLEVLLRQTDASHRECFRNTEDSLRNLVKIDLDAVLEEKVECIIKKINGVSESFNTLSARDMLTRPKFGMFRHYGCVYTSFR